MADAEQVQEAYTTILRHVVQTGRAPHHTDLARALGTTPDEAKGLQEAAAAAAAGCWIAPDTDYVQSWAPFSNIPTQYLVSVNSVQKWYGQ
ncbi:MAG: hypothetical protein V3R30_00795 [Kiloniellales bacterium]